MSKTNSLNINNYKNIWADHQRNDLKKIEFIVGDDFLPQKILIYFMSKYEIYISNYY